MLIQIHAQENFVEITGSTNVNNFKCINNTFKAPGGAYSFTGRQLPISIYAWQISTADTEKMGGMIVVKDDLDLVFALNAQL